MSIKHHPPREIVRDNVRANFFMVICFYLKFFNVCPMVNPDTNPVGKKRNIYKKTANGLLDIISLKHKKRIKIMLQPTNALIESIFKCFCFMINKGMLIDKV